MKTNDDSKNNCKNSYTDLNDRVRVTQRFSGWAVIVDKKLYTWGVTQDKANSIALHLMHKDIL